MGSRLRARGSWACWPYRPHMPLSLEAPAMGQSGSKEADMSLVSAHFMLDYDSPNVVKSLV